MPILKRGSNDPLVVMLKKRLYAHGFWKKAWGYRPGFGRITDRQVRSFQKAKGLLVDGEVGSQTWAALNRQVYKKSKGERARAMRWAEGCVGITESPAFSNRGPRISRWQRLSGYPDAGVAWCQCFVNASAHAGSRGRIKPSWFGGYTPSVVSMANSRQHGLVKVPLGAAQPGDWVYFKFPGVSTDLCDHVGLFVADHGSTISTIEGNTSPEGSNGSQSNGGGCFRRIRSKSLVVAVVRPPFRS